MIRLESKWVLWLQDEVSALGWAFKSLQCGAGLPWWLRGKESACHCRRLRGQQLVSWGGKIPWRGNGNAVQYSCLENPWTEEPGRLQAVRSQRSQTRLRDWMHCGAWPQKHRVRGRAGPGRRPLEAAVTTGFVLQTARSCSPSLLFPESSPMLVSVQPTNR